MIERVNAAIRKHIEENGEKPRRLVMTAMQYMELDKDMRWLEKYPAHVCRNLEYNGIPIWIDENPDESHVNK